MFYRDHRFWFPTNNNGPRREHVPAGSRITGNCRGSSEQFKLKLFRNNLSYRNWRDSAIMFVLSAIGLFHSFVFKMAVDQVLEFMLKRCGWEHDYNFFRFLLSFEKFDLTKVSYFGFWRGNLTENLIFQKCPFFAMLLIFFFFSSSSWERRMINSYGSLVTQTKIITCIFT